MERIRITVAAVLILLSLVAGASGTTVTDSIPPPPPGIGDSIAGADSACTGEVIVYSIDAPVGCNCEWTLDSIIQPSSGCVLETVFTTAGTYVIGVSFDCHGRQNNILDHVTHVTAPPSVDLGPDTSVHQGGSIVLDAGNPGCSYLWSTGETSRTIEVTEAGDYGVTAFNECGEDTDSINVMLITSLYENGPALTGVFCTQETLYIRDHRNWESLTVMNHAGITIYHGKPVDKLELGDHGIVIVVLRSLNRQKSLKIAH